jgi:hypothetical protein
MSFLPRDLPHYIIWNGVLCPIALCILLPYNIYFLLNILVYCLVSLHYSISSLRTETCWINESTTIWTDRTKTILFKAY